ncbi:DUF6582 domain-containing protein [Deinococcus humi]|uniref:Uncharacterized protein n=1 Tax=Deinococcus humi TaxID=662880 RepID=A0A7W8JXW5_9DEIO|nr:DUF6582 domain-containing protein [Deinococcus humi]MBB5365256.1 hypothetical protein [Deinococcus humi]GGO35779.1 hypothetical protein GCM10008949_38820 [Deinococcus humi]
MSDLTTEERNDLNDKAFAYIDKDGGRHLPIHDESHARNAVGRFAQTGFESAEAKHQAAQHIVAVAKKHGIELSEDDAVRQAASGD